MTVLWRYRYLIIGVGIFVIGGCSAVHRESFVFQADMPENFEIDGTAHYKPAAGQTCNFASEKERKNAERIFFRYPQPKTAHQVEFTVPLTAEAHGCSMVLSNLALGFEGQWGPDESDRGMQYGGISILDEPAEYAASIPETGPLVLQGQCQWFFRTYGRYRYIVKIPQCRRLDGQGNVLMKLIGGAVQRDKLVGKTVKLVLSIEKDELPAVDNNWIKFPTGWKRCMGKGLDDGYAFCSGNTTDFKPFKMPDGRDCIVYPNCIE